jgi:predicted nucleotidyltransferase
MMDHLDPVAAGQVDSTVDLLRDVLGDAISGVYLFGSAVRGGLGPDSDLDLLVALDRPTTDDERRTMIRGLLARSRSPARRERRHLEVTAVLVDAVKPWRYPPPMEFQYGDWWRAEFEAGELAPWSSPNPDLAIVLTTVRDDSVAVQGPPARALFDPVPRADLDHALRDVIPELLPGLADDDTRNSLLTLARIWLTLATGRIEPKDVAASWALERMPDGAGEALRLARSAYLGEAADRWDDAAKGSARADADTMLAAIESSPTVDAGSTGR